MGKCKCKCPERLIVLFSSSRYFFQIPIPVRTNNAWSTIYRDNRIIVKRNKRNRDLFYKRLYIFRIKFFPPCPIGVQIDITRMMAVDGFNFLHQFTQTRQIIHFRFILQMIGIQSRMIHHRFYNLFGSSNRQEILTRSYHFHSGLLCGVKHLQCCFQIIVPSQININAGCFHHRKFLQRLVCFHSGPCYNREFSISCRDIRITLNDLNFLCLYSIRYYAEYSRTSGSCICICSNCHSSVSTSFGR